MKTVFGMFTCIAIAAIIMNPKPIIEINIYKGKEDDKAVEKWNRRVSE